MKTNVRTKKWIEAEIEAEKYMAGIELLRVKLAQACRRANTSKDRYAIADAIREADTLREKLASLNAYPYMTAY